jgi:predicted DCC family thiol-disulfide oxidoreductase YuxK
MRSIGLWLLAPLLLLAAALEGCAWLLGRRPTRARAALGHSLLIYDDGCGLCSFTAVMAQQHLGDVELLGLSRLPREGVLESLDADAIAASAHYVTAEGVEYHGGEAITRLLRESSVGRSAAVLDLPVLRGLRELGYCLVARQRSRISRAFGVG